MNAFKYLSFFIYMIKQKCNINPIHWLPLYYCRGSRVVDTQLILRSIGNRVIAVSFNYLWFLMRLALTISLVEYEIPMQHALYTTCTMPNAIFYMLVCKSKCIFLYLFRFVNISFAFGVTIQSSLATLYVFQ